MREFKFNGTTIADPDEDMSLEDVKRVLATQYPSLTNATISGPEDQNGIQVYTFTAAVKTKG